MWWLNINLDIVVSNQIVNTDHIYPDLDTVAVGLVEDLSAGGTVKGG